MKGSEAAEGGDAEAVEGSGVAGFLDRERRVLVASPSPRVEGGLITLKQGLIGS